MTPQKCWVKGPLDKDGLWLRPKLETRSSSQGVGEDATVGYRSPQPTVPSGHRAGKRDIRKCRGRIGRALRRVSLDHVSLNREYTSRTPHHPLNGRRRVDGDVVGGASRRTHVEGRVGERTRGCGVRGDLGVIFCMTPQHIEGTRKMATQAVTPGWELRENHSSIPRSERRREEMTEAIALLRRARPYKYHDRRNRSYSKTGRRPAECMQLYDFGTPDSNIGFQKLSRERSGYSLFDWMPCLGLGVTPADTTQPERREEADGGQEVSFDPRSAVPYLECTGHFWSALRIWRQSSQLEPTWGDARPHQLRYLIIRSNVRPIMLTPTIRGGYDTDSPDPDAQTRRKAYTLTPKDNPACRI
ncbi:hypothetical protein H4582DRAFT_2054046 [Lactarius indigo]|nr:hypothetical protein H4582DRAFT_2054046 [Lactarius indigo]